MASLRRALALALLLAPVTFGARRRARRIAPRRAATAWAAAAAATRGAAQDVWEEVWPDQDMYNPLGDLSHDAVDTYVEPLLAVAGPGAENLPGDAPVIWLEELAGAERFHFEASLAGEQPWPAKWAWYPEFSVSYAGDASWLSGRYVLVDLDLTEPVWTRMGRGQQVNCTYHAEDGAWQFYVWWPRSPHHKIPAGDEEWSMTYEEPQWSPAITMQRRGNPLVGLFSKQVRLSRQAGLYIEGLPVYKSSAGDSWVASMGGRWHYATLAEGKSFKELVREGFFYAGAPTPGWSFRSAYHEGHGPEDVAWEAPSSGDDPEIYAAKADP